jgi:hypothetical protein
MANPDHLAILKQGVEVWNKWRKQNPNIRPDLSAADLFETELAGINLSKADLSACVLLLANLAGANLVGTDLTLADLRASHLVNANFENAVLLEANLRDAVLDSANLRNALIAYANFSNANLSGVNLSKASCQGTIFADVDLSAVKGLKSVKHEDSSTIGINTLYKSKGKIPEEFLRGCGVPDQMIQYAISLTVTAIEYYSCFISYSHKDEEFARRIYNDLQASGVRCWFAPQDIQAGKKIHHQIDEAIKVYEKMLLVLSLSSMDSDWVQNEIIIARKKEDELGRQMLFPISIVPYSDIKSWVIDSKEGRDIACEIREYFIPDFSCWKYDHDSYTKAFRQLLINLKSSDSVNDWRGA